MFLPEIYLGGAHNEIHNSSGVLAERVLNMYRAFESLPYGFSSKFGSKDAN